MESCHADNKPSLGLEIAASCEAKLEEEEPRTLLKVGLVKRSPEDAPQGMLCKEEPRGRSSR